MEGAEERRWQPSSSNAWHETHQLVILEANDRIVLLRLTFWPNRGVGEFLAIRADPGERPVVLHDAELPVPDDRWEVRSSGIWVELVCETPLTHWSYGLEAFALIIDSPAQLVTSPVGDLVPMGWELEFESREAAVRLGAESAGYEQSGIAHGILLDASGQSEVQGAAKRWHWWDETGPEHQVFSAALPTNQLAADPAPLAVVRQEVGHLAVLAGPGRVVVSSIGSPARLE